MRNLGDLTSRGIVLYFILGAMVVPPSPDWAAEKPNLPMFNLVDEAVGYVKAKGKCEVAGLVNECRLRVDLPKEKRPGSRGVKEWSVVAWLEAFETKSDHRWFNLRINRVRSVSLSAKDATANLNVVRASIYHFEADWKITESRIGIYIENGTGEEIPDLEIPTPNALSHRDGSSDVRLF